MNVQMQERQDYVPAPDPGVLRLVPLGGLGTIGKNMMLVEFEEDILVVDAGSMFPSEEEPGVNLIIPDVAYLLENQDRVRAIVLTHGHEDHIGALPFLINDFGLEVPIYGADLTMGVVRHKLQDRKVPREALDLLQVVDVDSRLQIGCFEVEFFQVNHSFPSSMGTAIQTPVGRIIHTGDFKFDEQPVVDEPVNEARLARWGEEGVLLLMADSTNAEEVSPTSSEITIENKLQELFEEAPGRIFVSTFASNVSRLQQVITLARRNGRRVGWVGRSMFTYGDNAVSLNYLDFDKQDLLSTREINTLPDEDVCVLITGSQGEPMSALNRLSQEAHRDHDIRPTDTVMISASPIPGNEVAFYGMVNRLFRLGAEVFYHCLVDIHVSGHGSQRENRRMMSLLRPRYFVPVHGEYRHLLLNARNAHQAGLHEDNIFILEDGQVLALEQTGGPGDPGLPETRAWYAETVSAAHILIDGHVISDSAQIIKERHWLKQGGVISCVIGYDARRRQMLGQPLIHTRGFLYPEEESEFHGQARKLVTKQFNKLTARGIRTSRKDIEQDVRGVLNRFCKSEFGRRPLIMTKLLPLA